MLLMIFRDEWEEQSSLFKVLRISSKYLFKRSSRKLHLCKAIVCKFLVYVCFWKQYPLLCFQLWLLSSNSKSIYILRILGSLHCEGGVFKKYSGLEESQRGEKTAFKTGILGTSLVVQWLRLWAPNAGGPGSILGQGTRSHMHATTKEQASLN